MVLELTVERIIVGDLYGDLPLGLYIVRGENVVLMAEIVRFSPKIQEILIQFFLIFFVQNCNIYKHATNNFD